MKVLHTSDWHVDRTTLGVPRFNEIESAAWQTVQTAVDEKVDLYLHTGDIADPDDGAAALDAIGLVLRIVVWLNDHGIRSLWGTGNHDVFEDGTGRSTLSPLLHVGSELRATVASVPALYKFDEVADAAVLMLPYVALSHAYDPDEYVRNLVAGEWAEGRRVLVATHLSFEGALLGDETTEMRRGRDVQFPWEACDPSWTIVGGHYHRRQRIAGPGGRVAHICGALARLSFGEEHNMPAYSIIEV